MKNKKIIILISIFVVVFIGILFSKKEEQEVYLKKEEAIQVSVLDVSKLNGFKNEISINGVVESNNQATLSSEVGGVVGAVFVSIGQNVLMGDPLIELNKSDALLRLQEANSLLRIQEARLEEMKSGALEGQIRIAEIAFKNAEDNLEKTIEDSEETIQSALRNLLNNDLQAYLGDERIRIKEDDTITSPTISGVYNGEKGEYRLSLYGSLTQSGYSFRYEGPNNESGVGSVSTLVPQPLGDSGLYILFPEGFASYRDLEWVIPIPNKRGVGYLTVKDAYDNALRNQEPAIEQAEKALQQAENELILLESGTRKEQISAQEAQVNQARIGVSSAESYLEKHTVRAPFSGTVSMVSVNVGQNVGAGQQMINLINESGLRINSRISPNNARLLSVGDLAVIDNNYNGRVSAISRAVDEQTGQVELHIMVDKNNNNLIVGENVLVEIKTNSTVEGALVPLSVVEVSSSGNAVYTVENGKAKRVSVSLGSVKGDKVTITDGLEEVDLIIENYSLIKSGKSVQIINEIKNEK